MAKAPTILNKPAEFEPVGEVKQPKAPKEVHPMDQASHDVEQANHEAAKKLADNVPLTGKTEEEEAEQRKLANARLERIRQRAYIPDEETQNAKPSNWSIASAGGEDIRAVNRVTGAVYEGPRKGFLK